MALKTRLFSETITFPQIAVISSWFTVLALIIVLWAKTSLSLYSTGASGVFVGTGRAFGLLAVFFALTQFMLMGRIAWIEKPFGLDKLASYHRFNGYMALTCIIIHPVLIIAGYSLGSHTGYFAQYAEVLKHYPYVIYAFISEFLFIGVVGTTIYIVRKHLKFESWYFVHLLVYAAIVLAFFHQVANGGSFQGGPLARVGWYALYVFVALNLIIWRFGLPIYNLVRFKWVVQKVVKETSTTVSIYIAARGIHRWKVRAGQFVLVRFFSKGFWWQEHPFSVSRLPDGKTFRLTVRSIGDYTSVLPNIKPGTKVLVSGPYGRFTKNVAQTRKRLFIAGGVGITPIGTLAREAIADNADSILIFGNRTPDDTVFKSELQALTGLKTILVYSDAPKDHVGEVGRIDLARIKRLVPDFNKRDLFLCGPPPMMEGIVKEILDSGFPSAQLHFERFALHN